MNQLIGHISPETAYVVDDYPYGFVLRTQIRYWIETNKTRGQRFVSQTINPKTNRWNKPKASTYTPILVMYLNPENRHVETDHLGWYSTIRAVEDFATEWKLDKEQQAWVNAFLAANRKLSAAREAA